MDRSCCQKSFTIPFLIIQGKQKEYQVYPSQTVLFWYNGTIQSLVEIKTDDFFLYDSLQLVSWYNLLISKTKNNLNDKEIEKRSYPCMICFIDQSSIDRQQQQH